MNITILTKNNPFYVSSASANRLRSLIEGLQKKEIEVQLWITHGYTELSEKEKMGVSGVHNEIRYEYLSTNLTDSLWKRRFDSYIGTFFKAIKLKRKLKRKLATSDQIIWVPKDHLLWKVMHTIKKKNSSLKLFCEMSEFLDIHKYNKGNFLQRFKGDRAQKFFEKTFIYDLDGFALMTKTLFEHYQNFEGNLPEMIHLPMTVDQERFQKIKPKLDGFIQPYIAFVGVMNNAKDGVDILLKAFKNISNDFPEYNLYLVGPWNYDTPSHLGMIKNYGLQDRIVWKGAFDRDQIPNIIQNADLLVLPRPDSKQAQGGFPTKLGEYLATGNPVAATTVGEIPEYLRDGESIFFSEPGSVEGFEKAMRKALSDSDQAEKVGKKGKKVAIECFNKDKQAQILYKFLKKLDNESN